MARSPWPAPGQWGDRRPDDGQPADADRAPDDTRFSAGCLLAFLAWGAFGAGAALWIHGVVDSLGRTGPREDYLGVTVTALVWTAGVLAVTSVGLIACSKRSGVARLVAAFPAALLSLYLLWLLAQVLAHL